MSRFSLLTDSFGGRVLGTQRPTACGANTTVPLVMLGSLLGVLAGWYWGASNGPMAGLASASASPLAIRSPTGADMPLDHGGRNDGLKEERSEGDERRGNMVSELGAAGARGTTAKSTDGSDGCLDGMRHVAGEYCSAVSHRCLEPYSDGSGRCARFSPGSVCHPPVFTLRFCIDEFEFPNRLGEKPQVMMTFTEAERSCESVGKRLCTAREWTLACEGPERLPYPIGHVRDATACNIDLVHRFPDFEALNNPATTQRELARLDQRTASGSLPRCVSAFGAYDMMGNVDEWVVPDGPEESAGYGSKTALKGGYFGPVRARCRPSTPSHAPSFKFYQVGFRCCSDAPAHLVIGPGL